MDLLKKEFHHEKKENPYVQCLADLLEPPTKVYCQELIDYYEQLSWTSTGRKRDAIEKNITRLKIICKQGI